MILATITRKHHVSVRNAVDSVDRSCTPIAPSGTNNFKTKKNAVFWDMMTPCASCRTNVSEEHIASIFRAKDSDSPWFAARMYLTTDGEEPFAKVPPLSCPSVTVEI
jgi:hypothetical protein